MYYLLLVKVSPGAHSVTTEFQSLLGIITWQLSAAVASWYYVTRKDFVLIVTNENTSKEQVSCAELVNCLYLKFVQLLHHCLLNSTEGTMNESSSSV